MSLEYFKKYFDPTERETKAYNIGLADGIKRQGRNTIVYDPSNEAINHKESISLIEAASLLIQGDKKCKLCIGVTENGEETNETDEIMIEHGKYLALIILKGLSLKLRVIKHLDNVRFNEDFSSARIEYPNKDK